jgi:hypothetical protein
MRMMLGTNDNPSLLVNIEQEYSPDHFEFWVVNGAWQGTFYQGKITVWHPDSPWTDLVNLSVLSQDQDRLRGDYQPVFDNWSNPNWRAPKSQPVEHLDWDDDIPF